MKFFTMCKFTLVILLIGIVCGVKTEENEPLSEKNMVYSNATYFLQGQASQEINFDYRQLFKYIGDKTFICITLLYFQTSHLILFTSSFTLKLALSHLDTSAYCKLADIIPIEVFQLFGLIAYFLYAFSILYNLMFFEGKVNLNNSKPKRRNEEGESINLIMNLKTINIELIEALVKISGMIMVSHILDGNIMEADGLTSVLDAKKNKLIKFGIDTTANLFSVIAAMMTGYLLSKQMNMNTNLLFSSITFLLMGTDICLKFFAY